VPCRPVDARPLSCWKSQQKNAVSSRVASASRGSSSVTDAVARPCRPLPYNIIVVCSSSGPSCERLASTPSQSSLVLLGPRVSCAARGRRGSRRRARHAVEPRGAHPLEHRANLETSRAAHVQDISSGERAATPTVTSRFIHEKGCPRTTRCAARVEPAFAHTLHAPASTTA